MRQGKIVPQEQVSGKLEKLVFLKVVSLVIKSGMNILGVETTEEM